MWASKGVRKCAVLHYREIKYKPVIPDAKRQRKVRFGSQFFLTHLEEHFFLKAMLSGEFP